MAIHFRSQIVNQEIKGTVSDASELGWCCDGVSTTQKTRANCQGYPFILNATDANQCAASGTCPSNFAGIIPGACCYWKIVNGNYVQECASADSYEACSSLHQGFDEGLQYSFYPGQYCQNNGGSVVCNGVKRVYGDDTNCNPDDSTDCFDPNNVLGNCCYNQLEGRICSITTKPECGNGVWSPPKNGVVMSCVNGAPCDGVYFSGPLNYPTTTTIEQVTNSTSEIEKLPQIGDYYQGGIFVGIFNPGTPINSSGGSLVYGNTSTGNASDYRARAGVGYGRTGWILIADLEDHVADSDYTGINLFDNIPFMSSNIIPDSFVSSTYDGLYNTIENTSELYSKILSYSSNGFTDWYLPSQDELALYFKNIKPDTQLFNGYSIPQGSYLSSTLFSLGAQRKFNDAYFNYTQQATTDSYGKVNLLPVTEKAKIKLFRRIYLGAEISSVIEPETCSGCLVKARDLYLKNVAAEQEAYKEHVLMIENGVDLNDKPISGGWHDCFADAFIGALTEFTSSWSTDSIIGFLSIILGVSADAIRTTEAVCVQIQRCSATTGCSGWYSPSGSDPLIFGQVQRIYNSSGRACFQSAADAARYIAQLKFIISRDNFDPRVFYNFRTIVEQIEGLPNWVPGAGAAGAGSGLTVAQLYRQRLMTLLRSFNTGGITGVLSRLKNLLLNWQAIAALFAGLVGFEIGRLLRSMEDAYKCIQIKKEELEQHRRRLYGKPECQTGAPPGRKCNSKCTTLDCTGRMGVLLAEWRKAALACCKGVCDNISAYCSERALPPDPGLKGTDIITPFNPGSTREGRELLGTSNDQTNIGNTSTN